MARLSKAGQAAWREATTAAYESTSTGPIQEFLRVWGNTLPQWAQTQIRRDVANIYLFQRQEQEKLGASVGFAFGRPNASIAEALIDMGNGVYKTARVYITSDMTYADYLARVEELRLEFAKDYPGKDDQGYALVPFIAHEQWRYM